MIRKIKDYHCDYCGEPTDFGNLCQTCKSKKRRGAKLEKLYKNGICTITVGDIVYVKEFKVEKERLLVKNKDPDSVRPNRVK